MAEQRDPVLPGRTPTPENLEREVRDLEKLGHEYQVRASVLLRSGRPGYEAWFEAGLELKRAAQRLGLIRSAARVAAPVSSPGERSGQRVGTPRLIRPLSPPAGRRGSE
jgi:hypothetical protein